MKKKNDVHMTEKPSYFVVFKQMEPLKIKVNLKKRYIEKNFWIGRKQIKKKNSTVKFEKSVISRKQAVFDFDNQEGKLKISSESQNPLYYRRKIRDDSSSNPTNNTNKQFGKMFTVHKKDKVECFDGDLFSILYKKGKPELQIWIQIRILKGELKSSSIPANTNKRVLEKIPESDELTPKSKKRKLNNSEDSKKKKTEKKDKVVENKNLNDISFGVKTKEVLKKKKIVDKKKEKKRKIKNAEIEINIKKKTTVANSVIEISSDDTEDELPTMKMKNLEESSKKKNKRDSEEKKRKKRERELAKEKEKEREKKRKEEKLKEQRKERMRRKEEREKKERKRKEKEKRQKELEKKKEKERRKMEKEKREKERKEKEELERRKKEKEKREREKKEKERKEKERKEIEKRKKIMKEKKEMEKKKKLERKRKKEKELSKTKNKSNPNIVLEKTEGRSDSDLNSEKTTTKGKIQKKPESNEKQKKKKKRKKERKGKKEKEMGSFSSTMPGFMNQNPLNILNTPLALSNPPLTISPPIFNMDSHLAMNQLPIPNGMPNNCNISLNQLMQHSLHNSHTAGNNHIMCFDPYLKNENITGLGVNNFDMKNIYNAVGNKTEEKKNIKKKKKRKKKKLKKEEEETENNNSNINIMGGSGKEVNYVFPNYNQPVNCLPLVTPTKQNSLLLYLKTEFSPDTLQWVFYSDKDFLVIYDPYPKSQFHLLAISRREINEIGDLEKKDIDHLKKLQDLSKSICTHLLKCNSVYLKGVNLKCGFHSLPSMRRLHLHIISDDFTGSGLKTEKHYNSFVTDFFVPLDNVIQDLESIGKISINRNKCLKYLSSNLICRRCGTKYKSFKRMKPHLKDCRGF